MVLTKAQNEVRKTRSYDRFSFLNNNRETNRPHVEALKEAIEMNPQLAAAQPILVNDHYQIIDGQHRFTAMEELKLPVYYMTVPGLSVNDARQMNVLHRGWGVMDYARSYALSGDTAYQNYLQLREDYSEFNHSVILLAIFNGDKQGIFSDFRKGLLQIEDLTGTRQRLSMLADLADYTSYYRMNPFGEAFFKVSKVEGFDLERFKRKLEQVGGTLLSNFQSSGDFVRAFEDIYNYQITENHRLRLY